MASASPPRLRVDFHRLIGAGLVLASSQGQVLRPGDEVAVFDDDTATYAGVVACGDGDTLLVRVADGPLPE